MAPPQTADLAAQRKIPADGRVREQPETIEERHRAAGLLHQPVRLQREVGRMADGEDHRLHPGEGVPEIPVNAERGDGPLVFEEPGPRLSLGRIVLSSISVPRHIPGGRPAVLRRANLPQSLSMCARVIR